MTPQKEAPESFCTSEFHWKGSRIAIWPHVSIRSFIVQAIANVREHNVLLETELDQQRQVLKESRAELKKVQRQMAEREQVRAANSKSQPKSLAPAKSDNASSPCFLIKDEASRRRLSLGVGCLKVGR